MGAQTALVPNQLSVRPGEQVIAELTVTNTGRVVDSFALDILGPVAAFAYCDPPTVSVFPGQADTARVIFAPPPDASVPAGLLGFGIHVRSHEDPQGSVVEEGRLEIAATPLVSAEMSPRTSRARGRRRGQHQVAVDNTGNTPVTVALVGYDEDEAVEVSAEPAQLDVAPGTAAFLNVTSRGRRRFWRGPAKTHPFFVEARSPGVEPVRMPGTLLQEAVVPKWVPRLILILLALLVALVLLWVTLFKPVIKDTAKDAADTAAKAALSSAAQAAGGGGGAPTSSTPPPSPTTSATTSPTKSPTGPPTKPKTTTPKPPPSTEPPRPFALLLSQETPTLSAAARTQLGVTDVVLQNPFQDKGIVSITQGSVPLMTVNLDDFRNYDLHFITPILITPSKPMSFAVTCLNKGGKSCTAAALIDGTSGKS